MEIIDVQTLVQAQDCSWRLALHETGSTPVKAMRDLYHDSATRAIHFFYQQLEIKSRVKISDVVNHFATLWIPHIKDTEIQNTGISRFNYILTRLRKEVGDISGFTNMGISYILHEENVSITTNVDVVFESKRGCRSKALVITDHALLFGSSPRALILRAAHQDYSDVAPSIMEIIIVNPYTGVITRTKLGNIDKQLLKYILTNLVTLVKARLFIPRPNKSICRICQYVNDCSFKWIDTA